jgi:RimJ/RimL family protein N-acetyltransferase
MTAALRALWRRANDIVAESWAREQGMAMLTLNVFDGNARARRVYERNGFAPETLRYVKAVH